MSVCSWEEIWLFIEIDTFREQPTREQRERKRREKSGKKFIFPEFIVETESTVSRLCCSRTTPRVGEKSQSQISPNLRRCMTFRARQDTTKSNVHRETKIIQRRKRSACSLYILLSQQVWILLHFKRKLWGEREEKKQRKNTKQKREQLNKSAR